MLAAALSYAEQGMPVFPLHSLQGEAGAHACTCGKATCTSPGKHPRTPNGLHDATSDTLRVIDWWQRWPDANIGIPTGAASGLVVLDVDGPAGSRALHEIERKHGNIKTARVLTGSGGEHLLFKHPGSEVANSAGKLAQGLDVRGDGGYVVAAPSLHLSGNRYKWTRALERGIAELPDWFTALAAPKPQERQTPQQVADVIPEGQRRQAMLRLAGVMRRQGMGAPEILAALEVANRTRCVPPLEQKELSDLAADIQQRYQPNERGVLAQIKASLDADTQTAADDQEELPTRNLATYQIRVVDWLDKPFLQRSAFHLLAGRKGTCKGTYLCGLAAKVTRGDLYDTPKRVIVLTSEDSVELDFLPRFVAAGGATELVQIINVPFKLPGDLGRLEKVAARFGDVGLIIIDPIGNHLGGADTNDEGRVREAIGPLNQLADKLDCMVFGVRHLGKGTNTNGALATVLGSTAWVDVPRCVILMARDDEDEMVFHCQVVAGNRGPRSAGRQIRLAIVDVPPAKEITLAVDEGVSTKDVDELLGAKKSGADLTRSKAARELILDILEADGDQESDKLDARVAKETGLSAGSVVDVRKKLREEGLIKARPERDETGQVSAWTTYRTLAPRS